MSIVLGKTFASILIKASDFKVQDSQPQIGKSLEISNTLWRLKCINTKLWKWVSFGNALMYFCDICFLSSLWGFSLRETFVFAERSYLLLHCTVTQFLVKPVTSMGKTQKLPCNTGYYSMQQYFSKLANCICSDRLSVFLTVKLQYFW